MRARRSPSAVRTRPLPLRSPDRSGPALTPDDVAAGVTAPSVRSVLLDRLHRRTDTPVGCWTATRVVLTRVRSRGPDEAVPVQEVLDGARTLIAPAVRTCRTA